MSSYKRAINYLFHNRNLFFDSCVKHLSFLFSDKTYLSLRYRFLMGNKINWENPITFTEKIQWLKIYGFKPEYTMYVDKLAVKEVVKKKCGEKYIIPTLFVWDKVSEINWESLPSQFVLKTSHGGGGTGVVICKDKTTLDIKKASDKLNHSMKCIIGKEFRERPYYDVPKKVFAEQYMSNALDNDSELIDYKFYCFNGEPTFCQVIRNRQFAETIDFYDMEWQLMPFVGLNPKCSNGKKTLSKPDGLNTMINICKKLSTGIPFLRVDLYYINKKVYFGEMTFYPGGGMGRFTPPEWNNILGNLIKL